MRSKFQRSSASGIKIVGALTLTALGAWLLYCRLKPRTFSPLPEALESNCASFISEPAGQVSYYADRHSQGRPLVLLHSINAAASSFEMKPLFEHYRASRPIYALDLPGYGCSERSGSRPYLPNLYAQTIIDMLVTQVGEPADVVALSLSSEFVARAAWLRPDLFNSLALISPTGLKARQVRAPGEKVHQFLTFPLWSQGLFDLLTTRRSINFFLGKNFVGEVPETLVNYAYTTSHRPGARFAPLYFLSGQMFSPDICPTIYQNLTVPSLVIYDRDPNLTFEKLPDLLADNKLWQATRVAPSLGLPHWELLAETAAVLDQFWAKI